MVMLVMGVMLFGELVVANWPPKNARSTLKYDPHTYQTSLVDFILLVGDDFEPKGHTGFSGGALAIEVINAFF